MNQLMKITRAIVGISFAGLLFVGCHTSEQSFKNDVSGGTSPAGGGGIPTGNVFQVGDPVKVDFSGVNSQNFNPQTLNIKDDGTITLPYISTLETNAVHAVGKSPGDLEREIQTIYSKYYRTLTVTVEPLQRYFYVQGEVIKSSAYPYLGPTDIIKAISAAGGFTDFANKKKVQLKRSGAEKPIIVNCVKALENQKYNVSVYPGDTISVPRRNPFGF